MVMAICDMTTIRLGDIEMETIMSLNKLPITIDGAGDLFLLLKK